MNLEDDMLLTNQSTTGFVSTFLSHSSTDSELVEAVAKRLGRRGVLAWLDKNELLEMTSLDVELKRKVQQQATFTIFLSENFLKSEWCRDELKWAIEAQVGTDHLLPVYLGDPLQLVNSHDLLRNRFLDAFGKLSKLGYFCSQNPKSPNPDAIAEKIAASAYRRTIPNSWSEVVIVLDQRGSGQRRGFPQLPDNIARLNAPILTFRSDLGLRQKQEILIGSDWVDTAQTMTNALSNALGLLRQDFCKVIALSNSQTGLAWAVGKQFDRTNNVELYGYDRFGNMVTNAGQERITPLLGGNPDCAQLVNGEANPLCETQQEVALGIGKAEQYADDVEEAVPHLPLLWIESDKISNSEEAMQLVKDIVASCKRLYREHKVREISLFWITANHVALLAAANLTTHGLPKIKYMERDHDRGEYIHLPMP